MARFARLAAVTIGIAIVWFGGFPNTIRAQATSEQAETEETSGQIEERGIPGFPACCIITAIDPRTGLVTAKDTGAGTTFEFKPSDPRQLAFVRVGQLVFANFPTKQVSLDGTVICCAILSMSAGSSGPARPIPPPIQPLAPPQGGTPFALPTISAGPAYRPPPMADRLSRKAQNTDVLHLRGEDDIKQASGIPEEARNLLIRHVRTLPHGDSDHYIVNRKLAEEWMRTHPVRPDAKPEEHKKKKCDLTHSEGCTQALQDEWDRAVQQWRSEWKHVTDELTHDWHMAEGCFADHALRAPNIPIQFSILPEFPLTFEKQGTTALTHGSASGKVKGTVSFGVPVEADVHAQVEMFYIPCMPFAVRPKSLGADGTMTVGSKIGAAVNATGHFEELFTIPPGGYPPIIIYVIPIVIGDIPIAELDVSVYLDGTVAVGGEGNLDGHFKLDARSKTAFDFQCSGHGCKGQAHNVPVPVTTSEDVLVNGRIHVKPAVYAALQLDLDYKALSARVGPQPYLWGDFWGCGAAAATQSTAAPTTTQELYALTADLDWGIELRAEVQAAGKQIGKPLLVPLLQPHHLWFKDLAPAGPNNAMVAGVDGTTSISSGRPGFYKIKMRPCYPYSDPLEYHLTWTGGATAIGNSGALPPGRLMPPSGPDAACTWQIGAATCLSDPRRDISLNLMWPQNGNYSLTVMPLSDKHGRIFAPDRSTQLNITVGTGGAAP